MNTNPVLIDEYKLLVCYILKSCGGTLSSEIIFRAIEGEKLAGYFDITEALSVLIEKGCVTLSSNGQDNLYTLTPEGENVLSVFEGGLGIVVRKRAARSAVRALTRQRIMRENRAEIIKDDRGVTLCLSVMEGDVPMFTITLSCIDEQQAAVLRDQFYKSPKLIYRGTMALLLGDVDSVGGFAAIAEGIEEMTENSRGD